MQVALLVIGAFANGIDRNVNINGTVSFSTMQVTADISLKKAVGLSIQTLSYEEVEGGEGSFVAGENQEYFDLDLGDFSLNDSYVYFGYQVLITNKQGSKNPIFFKIVPPNPTPTSKITYLTDESSVIVWDEVQKKYIELEPDKSLNNAYMVRYTEDDLEFDDYTVIVTFVFKIDPTSSPYHNKADDLGIDSTFELATSTHVWNAA